MTTKCEACDGEGVIDTISNTFTCISCEPETFTIPGERGKFLLEE